MKDISLLDQLVISVHLTLSTICPNCSYANPLSLHPLILHPFTQIKVPDVTKTRRIINCAADYVSCANPLYAPCCKSKQGASKAAPSPSPKPSARR